MQLVWLTYSERTRNVLSLDPADSPIIVGHPQLADERALSTADLTSFTVLSSDEAQGPLRPQSGRDGNAHLGSLLASLDPRLERVSYQQYLRVGVVRRDATFELFGQEGVLVLSGKDLRGASTTSALAPIAMRSFAWAGGTLGLVLIGLFSKKRLIGHTPYFERTDAIVTLLVWLAVGFGSLALGAVLRELKPKLKFGRLRPTEKAYVLATALLGVAALVVSVRSKPSFSEVHQALTLGDVAAARRVSDALFATLGDTMDVRETQDLIMLAEARTAPLAQSLKLLDAVAQRGGAKASEARRTARTRRLEEVRRLIQRKDGPQALKLLDTWFGNNWKTDRELAELKALAEEVALDRCQSVPCGLSVARRASLVSPTPVRLERVQTWRNDLLNALNAKPQPVEPTLAKLQRFRTLAETASEALTLVGDDRELAHAATHARTLALEARAKTPLIGASEAILTELVAPLTKQNDKISLFSIEGVTLHAVFDKQRMCRGLYAVGPKAGSRALASSTWPPERILSQALGRTVSLKRPTGTATVSRWAESGIPIVARWRSERLVELRIGDAAP